VGQEGLLDLASKGVPANKYPVELVGQLGDHAPIVASAGTMTDWASSAAKTSSASFAARRGERALTARVMRARPAARSSARRLDGAPSAVG
jgi:hypothetical protein